MPDKIGIILFILYIQLILQMSKPETSSSFHQIPQLVLGRARSGSRSDQYQSWVDGEIHPVRQTQGQGKDSAAGCEGASAEVSRSGLHRGRITRTCTEPPNGEVTLEVDSLQPLLSYGLSHSESSPLLQGGQRN